VEEVRAIAGEVLLRHPLRASDALQLAAAIAWAERRATGYDFVCLDERSRVARAEGSAFFRLNKICAERGS
jgi:hypothetical protein